MHTNLWKITPIQLALVAASILTPATASAVVVTYTLSGVTFGDGGTASGSFTYDSEPIHIVMLVLLQQLVEFAPARLTIQFPRA